MNEFESTNLVPARTIPVGTPDQIDEWFEEEEIIPDWESYLEARYVDPAEIDFDDQPGDNWGQTDWAAEPPF